MLARCVHLFDRYYCSRDDRGRDKYKKQAVSNTPDRLNAVVDWLGGLWHTSNKERSRRSG